MDCYTFKNTDNVIFKEEEFEEKIMIRLIGVV